jgi:hypothetical protein
MQLFPNASQDGNDNAEDMATIYSVKQDELFQEEKLDLGCSCSDSLEEAPAQRSWLRAITIYRDFMFSAFTDSYSTVRNGMLVVCFLYGKTCVTPSVQA